MFMEQGLYAVKLLVDSGKLFGEGQVEAYFNNYRTEQAGLFEWAESLITVPELQLEEFLFGVLTGIKHALEDDRNILSAYSGMFCGARGLRLPYPHLVDAILRERDYEKFFPVFTRTSCRDTAIRRLDLPVNVTRTTALCQPPDTVIRDTASKMLALGA